MHDINLRIPPARDDLQGDGPTAANPRNLSQDHLRPETCGCRKLSLHSASSICVGMCVHSRVHVQASRPTRTYAASSSKWTRWHFDLAARCNSQAAAHDRNVKDTIANASHRHAKAEPALASGCISIHQVRIAYNNCRRYWSPNHPVGRAAAVHLNPMPANVSVVRINIYAIIRARFSRSAVCALASSKLFDFLGEPSKLKA
jgi:hypothetical protein